MRLREILRAPVLTIAPGASADAAWNRMRESRVRHLAVTEGGRLVGVISERDVGGDNGAGMRRGHSVRELMTKSPATAEPGMTLRQAANLMRGRLVGSLPVVEDGELVGIVTATDVLDEIGRGTTRSRTQAERRPLRARPASVRWAVRKRRRQQTRR